MFVYIGELCRYLVNHPPATNEHEHKLRLAFGNGLSRDVWAEMLGRFAVPRLLEFYGSTEGNVSLFNFDGGLGAGRPRIPPWLAPGQHLHSPTSTSRPGPSLRRAGRPRRPLVRRAAGRQVPGRDPPRQTPARVQRLCRQGGPRREEGAARRAPEKATPGSPHRRPDEPRWAAAAISIVRRPHRRRPHIRWKGENVSTCTRWPTTLGSQVAGVKEASVYGVAAHRIRGAAPAWPPSSPATASTSPCPERPALARPCRPTPSRSSCASPPLWPSPAPSSRAR